MVDCTVLISLLDINNIDLLAYFIDSAMEVMVRINCLMHNSANAFGYQNIVPAYGFYFFSRCTK